MGVATTVGLSVMLVVGVSVLMFEVAVPVVVTVDSVVIKRVV